MTIKHYLEEVIAHSNDEIKTYFVIVGRIFVFIFKALVFVPLNFSEWNCTNTKNLTVTGCTSYFSEDSTVNYKSLKFLFRFLLLRIISVILIHPLKWTIRFIFTNNSWNIIVSKEMFYLHTSYIFSAYST